jgi:hypothetical protein
MRVHDGTDAMENGIVDTRIFMEASNATRNRRQGARECNGRLGRTTGLNWACEILPLRAALCLGLMAVVEATPSHPEPR